MRPVVAMMFINVQFFVATGILVIVVPFGHSEKNSTSKRKYELTIRLSLFRPYSYKNVLDAMLKKFTLVLAYAMNIN